MQIWQIQWIEYRELNDNKPAVNDRYDTIFEFTDIYDHVPRGTDSPWHKSHRKISRHVSCCGSILKS